MTTAQELQLFHTLGFGALAGLLSYTLPMPYVFNEPGYKQVEFWIISTALSTCSAAGQHFTEWMLPASGLSNTLGFLTIVAVAKIGSALLLRFK
jgi:hypothetical protein